MRLIHGHSSSLGLVVKPRNWTGFVQGEQELQRTWQSFERTFIRKPKINFELSRICMWTWKGRIIEFIFLRIDYTSPLKLTNSHAQSQAVTNKQARNGSTQSQSDTHTQNLIFSEKHKPTNKNTHTHIPRHRVTKPDRLTPIHRHTHIDRQTQRDKERQTQRVRHSNMQIGSNMIIITIFQIIRSCLGKTTMFVHLSFSRLTSVLILYYNALGYEQPYITRRCTSTYSW